MANGHLTEAETGILQGFLASSQINRKMLPTGMSVGMDSMGPMRDSKTDKLFPGIDEALGRFSTVLDRYQLMFVVATNGPDIEGVDILNALEGPVAACAVTQGGGKLISRQPQTDELDLTTLADEKELARLQDLETAVTERPLMRALLGDRAPIDGGPPIRTPYDTNIVITLPTTFEVLNARLSAEGVDLQQELPGVESADYVKQVLAYAHLQYEDAIARLEMGDQAAVLTKAQNRRNYVMPMHIHNGRELSKYSGAVTGSQHMSFTPGYHDRTYDLGNSLYVADKVVDTTEEGQQIIGVSERSMIVGWPTYFGDDSPNLNNYNVTHVISYGHLHFAEVTARLAVNVTMDDKLPRMDRVENVPILHISSGLKALGAITYLYQQLYG